MAYVYVPDPVAPQPGPYQPIYVPTPPTPTQQKTPKIGKQLSYKRAKKISDDWLKILDEIEQAKKGKGGDSKKKREGLNWIELSLLLIFVSIPVASLELIAAVMIAKMLPFR